MSRDAELAAQDQIEKEKEKLERSQRIKRDVAKGKAERAAATKKKVKASKEIDKVSCCIFLSLLFYLPIYNTKLFVFTNLQINNLYLHHIYL